MAKKAASKERRRNPRIHIKQKIYCKDKEQVRQMYVSNLSKGGLFLQTEFPPPVGTLMRLGLNLPDQVKELELTGKVVQNHPFGAGVQFLNLDKKALKEIEAYIADLEQGEESELVFAGKLTHVLNDPNVFLAGDFDLEFCSLPTILRHLREQRETGMLRLFNENQFYNIRVNSGIPVEITSSKFNENYCLGRILKKSGSITADDLNSSLKEMLRTGKKQGTILLERGLLTWEEIQRALEWQLEIKFDEVFNWENGTFLFYREHLMNDENEETWIEPNLDLQQVIFRSVYRQGRRRDDLLVPLLCNYDRFRVVPNKRELRAKNNRRLFTSEGEIHIWHYIVHLNASLEELFLSGQFSKSHPRAFVYGLLAAGLAQLHSPERLHNSAGDQIRGFLNSDNYFERLNVPWTVADRASIEAAKQQSLGRIQNLDGTLEASQQTILKRNLEEAFQTLSNDFRRQNYRRMVIGAELIQQMADRLYRLGKIKLNRGEAHKAFPLLQSAADLNPSHQEYDEWLKRAEQQTANTRSTSASSERG